jgi:hypothetical protein
MNWGAIGESTIFLMLNFRQGFRSFREGLDWRLIRDYWKAVRGHAWETFWGAGVLGIAFTVYTLYYAPARPYIPWAVAWAILVAGYFIWRADHVRLIPKLTVGPFELAYSNPKGPNATEKRRFVQVIVNCATECPLENCRGKLLGISKWSDGKWEPTRINESMDLWWSYVDRPTIMLEDKAPERLNVFYVENTSRNLVTCTQIPVRLACSPSDILRVRVRVAANDCPAEYIYFKVTFGDQWCDLYPEID